VVGFFDEVVMIFYSSFVMDAQTRRILLFRKEHARIWQTAHTRYRTPPKTKDENSRGLQEAFGSVFAIQESKHKPRVIDGELFSLVIVKTDCLHTELEYGDLLPWDIEEAFKLDLDFRTRIALKANIGLLMFFSDVDRDIWSPMQDFAHAASR
jgi:hypothetical protein